MGLCIGILQFQGSLRDPRACVIRGSPFLDIGIDVISQIQVQTCQLDQDCRIGRLVGIRSNTVTELVFQ